MDSTSVLQSVQHIGRLINGHSTSSSQVRVCSKLPESLFSSRRGGAGVGPRGNVGLDVCVYSQRYETDGNVLRHVLLTLSMSALILL